MTPVQFKDHTVHQRMDSPNWPNCAWQYGHDSSCTRPNCACLETHSSIFLLGVRSFVFELLGTEQDWQVSWTLGLTAVLATLVQLPNPTQSRGDGAKNCVGGASLVVDAILRSDRYADFAQSRVMARVDA